MFLKQRWVLTPSRPKFIQPKRKKRFPSAKWKSLHTWSSLGPSLESPRLSLYSALTPGAPTPAGLTWSSLPSLQAWAGAARRSLRQLGPAPGNRLREVPASVASWDLCGSKGTGFSLGLASVSKSSTLHSQTAWINRALSPPVACIHLSPNETVNCLLTAQTQPVVL